MNRGMFSSAIVGISILLIAPIQTQGGSIYRPPRPRRSAANHRGAQAAKAMMEMYHGGSGRWEYIEPYNTSSNSAWWQSGNALQSLLDFIWRSGTNREYLRQASNTIRVQRDPLPWFPQGNGEFRASSTDDTGWWALACCRMYDLTGNTSYLEIAQAGEAFMRSYWDDLCGGGIYWDVKPTPEYKNAISIQLLMKLQASLHNRIDIEGGSIYLEEAIKSWNWFNQSKMINSDNLVNDGLDSETCENNGQTEWTYNQGVILGALAELHLATGDGAYIEAARAIADAVVTSTELSPNGILTESCEQFETCNNDQTSFKGIFARNLAELNDLLVDAPYLEYLKNQSFSLYVYGRNGKDEYSASWDGPFETDGVSISTQSSALSLMTAVLTRNALSSESYSLPLPEVRYTPWERLDCATRKLAEGSLGYNESSWNSPGTAMIESLQWELLEAPQQVAAGAIGLDQDMWNCYINHYSNFSRDQLLENRVQEYWAILGRGYDGGGFLEVFNMEWSQLTVREQRAAQDLCFNNYTWSNNAPPLADWSAWQTSMTAQPSGSPSVTPIPTVIVSNNDVLPSEDSSVKPTLVTTATIIPGASYTLNAANRKGCVTILSICVGFVSLIA